MTATQLSGKPRPVTTKLFVTILLLGTWAAVYAALSTASEWIVRQFPLDPTSGAAQALAFFIYDTPKVLMLLTLIVFAMGVVRSFFSPERTRALLAGRREGVGNVAAAGLGVLTPFCSCSAVPLFIGFVSAGVPLGVTFSFLISAPLVNEVALGLLFALLGWKVAFLYLVLGLAVAIVAGAIIGRLHLEGWLEDWVRALRTEAAPLEAARPQRTDRNQVGRGTARSPLCAGALAEGRARRRGLPTIAGPSEEAIAIVRSSTSTIAAIGARFSWIADRSSPRGHHRGWRLESPIARDRGGSYALAAAKALPHATQVADRWHLMENASHAFLDAVRKSMRQFRAAVGAATINPGLLTAAERIQYEGFLRREDANAAILKLAATGTSIKEIVRLSGHSRGLVRRILRGQRTDVFRIRESSLEPHLQWLDAQWLAGYRNGAELWRRLKSLGFRGSLRVVAEWATRRRRAETVDDQALHRVPSARTIARLMTTGRDTLSKSETVTIAAVESGVPLLVEAREIVSAFHAMIRKQSHADLAPWVERASASLLASFANGVIKDKAAVSAAITSACSNGQTEGQITKLKLVKRQMYGRAKLDLLQARLIGAP